MRFRDLQAAKSTPVQCWLAVALEQQFPHPKTFPKLQQPVPALKVLTRFNLPHNMVTNARILMLGRHVGHEYTKVHAGDTISQKMWDSYTTRGYTQCSGSLAPLRKNQLPVSARVPITRRHMSRESWVINPKVQQIPCELQTARNCMYIEHVIMLYCLLPCLNWCSQSQDNCTMQNRV